jgi:hypothetical protein
MTRKIPAKTKEADKDKGDRPISDLGLPIGLVRVDQYS